jgi:hypothetical protein
MSLPALEWRKLPVRVLQVSQSANSLLDNIYDMLTGSVYHDNTARIPGTGSAWYRVTKFVTGSNTEAVFCFPPTKTEMSMSVIFAGKATSGTSTTFAAATASRENTIVGGLLYGACVKGAESSSFSQWTSYYPFGSSSNSTGYIKIGPSASVFGLQDRLTIYESKEAIALTMYDTALPLAGNYPFFGGAIIDPEQSTPTSSIDAEADGRLYGVIGMSGANGISPKMHNNHTGVLTEGTFLGSLFETITADMGLVWDGPKFYMFLPSSRFTMPCGGEKLSNQSTGNPSSWAPGPNYVRLSGKFVSTPIKCAKKSHFLHTEPQNYVGRLRDISVIRDDFDNQVIRDEYVGKFLGYTIASSQTTQSNAILLNYS